MPLMRAADSLPIRFIGVGEQAEDLRPFVAKEFVDALVTDDFLA